MKNKENLPSVPAWETGNARNFLALADLGLEHVAWNRGKTPGNHIGTFDPVSLNILARGHVPGVLPGLVELNVRGIWK